MSEALFQRGIASQESILRGFRGYTADINNPLFVWYLDPEIRKL